jgi:hypothetical protein
MPTRNARLFPFDGSHSRSFDRSQLPSIVASLVKLNAKHSLDSPQLWEVLDILPVAVMISTNRECTRIVGNVAARALLNATPIQNLSRSAPQDEKPPFQVYADARQDRNLARKALRRFHQAKNRLAV